MVADRITVGVYALEQVILPRFPGAKGWAARLAEASPQLSEGASAVSLVLTEGADGLALHGPMRLGDVTLPDAAQVVIEPVPARPDLFLVRVNGKALAVASSVTWVAGQELRSRGIEAPEALSAYAAGTLIDTPDGQRPVETLAAGDSVTTLGNGSRPLRWVGRRRVEVVEMLAHPGLRPVVFAAGTVGNERALSVSPRQRMLIDDWRAAVYFGEDRVLVAAQALVDDQAAQVVLPAGGVDYVVLLCDRHEVLLAEGALSESFHPGDAGLAGLSLTARAEIDAVVPEAELQRRRAAFPIVRNAEARALRLQL